MTTYNDARNAIANSIISGAIGKITPAVLKGVLDTVVDGAEGGTAASLASYYTSTQTDAAITAQITALIGAAPAALNTLVELATALGNDANYAATITTALAGKQPLHANLTGLAAQTSAADRVAYFTDTAGATALATFTSVGRTLVAQTTQALMRTTGLGMTTDGSALVAATNYAAMRTALDLVVGTNVQAYDATLQSLSALGTAADKIAYTTAIDTWAEAAITTAGRNMIAAADVAAQTALLNAFTSALNGLVPASGGGTTNYLRADGTWASPPGGGLGYTPVNQAGDSMTGDLTISKSAPVLSLAKTASGQRASVYGFTGANVRWVMSLGNDVAESGANAGSNFDIRRYTDGGVFAAVAFSIARSTGVASFEATPFVGANAIYHAGNQPSGLAKAWAKWDSAGTISGSFNVSSITDSGVGDFTVNLTSTITNTNHSALAGCRGQSDTDNSSTIAKAYVTSGTTVDVDVVNGVNTRVDSNQVHFVVF